VGPARVHVRPGVLAFVVVLALAAGASCGAGTVATSRCQSDDQCGDGQTQACSAGTCLPRAAPPPAWDVELTPRSDSASGLTELVDVSMPATAFDLTATAKVTLTGTITLDANAAPLTTAHVVLSVPSTIAGRPDLQFETDLSPTSATKLPAPTFTMPVPTGILGRTGTLRLLPGMPDNATHATSTFTLKIEPLLALPITSKSLTVQGRLLSAVGDPLANLLARAFQDGNLVSNVVQTDEHGAFTLMVPTGGADAVSPQALAVELEPATTDEPLPHFWATPFALTANLDLGDVHLPAYGQPNTFRFVFHGDTAAGAPVDRAIVRARTLLAMDATGTTDFLRDGLTDATGQASLSLFPGSTAALRLYDIAVVPPSDSGYATTCLEMFPLATGGLLTTIVLEPRPSLDGSVVGADGSPAAGVVVQATRTPDAQATACDAFAGTPQMTATTAADGTFSMRVDIGTYTLDFDPPAGAPYPRLTETAVAVAASGASHAVVLPPGAVVEGTLRDATGQPLPFAGVRFFAPACAAPMACVGAPPVLEAQARGDAEGHYRAVIPILPVVPNAPIASISPPTAGPQDASQDASQAD
jgi:hypothetical protein